MQCMYMKKEKGEGRRGEVETTQLEIYGGFRFVVTKRKHITVWEAVAKTNMLTRDYLASTCSLVGTEL